MSSSYCWQIVTSSSILKAGLGKRWIKYKGLPLFLTPYNLVWPELPVFSFPSNFSLVEIHLRTFTGMVSYSFFCKHQMWCWLKGLDSVQETNYWASPWTHGLFLPRDSLQSASYPHLSTKKLWQKVKYITTNIGWMKLQGCGLWLLVQLWLYIRLGMFQKLCCSSSPREYGWLGI